uniref:PQQ-dependent sugar dehydrogenase n=1 Tax=Candidatus Entotheonella palauensis TaxID=93172 RepID=UPI001178C30B
MVISFLFRLSVPVVVLALTVLPGIVLGQLTDPIPDPIPTGDLGMTLTPVATGLIAPNSGTFAPGLTQNHLFVTDQSGILWVLDVDTGTAHEYLNLSGLLGLDSMNPEAFKDRGLLGAAFHPNYAANGLLYTYTSEPPANRRVCMPTSEPPEEFNVDFTTLPPGSIPDHHSIISEWEVANPADFAIARNPDNTPCRILLRIDQPQLDNNGGSIGFGADGMLYISLGDGGSVDDPSCGHVEGDNGQNPGNILGSILRIDPRSTDSGNGQYGIPDDNPFYPGGLAPFGGQRGCDDDSRCDEIYAYGFRHPFRFSFDMFLGLMYVGDVGQQIQEIDIVVAADIIAGRHYGWNEKEGTFRFNANGTPPGCVSENAPNIPPNLTDPIAQYDQDDGNTVVGGFVYRGDSSALSGHYIFGDAGRPLADASQCRGRLLYLENIIQFDRETVEFLVTQNSATIQSAMGAFLLEPHLKLKVPSPI